MAGSCDISVFATILEASLDAIFVSNFDKFRNHVRAPLQERRWGADAARNW